MKIIESNKKSKDCGIVAAYNAASWCGMGKKYKEIEKLARGCGYNTKIGIRDFQFTNLVGKLGIPVRRIRKPCIYEVERDIYGGKLFLFIYFPVKTGNGHVVTLFLGKNGQIRMVNPESGRVTWGELASDVHAGGMKDYVVYEVSNRGKSKNDVA